MSTNYGILLLGLRMLFAVAVSVLLDTTVLRVQGYTARSDVRALEILYSTLNNPTNLSDWQSVRRDPCGDSWTGITCRDSVVVTIELSGLSLSGVMGYSLGDLQSVKKLDLSNNMISSTIPYQLPPNLTELNLARNNLSGGLPYSISAITSLNIMNLSHNSLTQDIGDVFGNLASLSTLDISFNNFTGNLPKSLGSLPNLSSIYVENNVLTGSLDLLSNLTLDNLNVANNNFSGSLSGKLISIPNFIYNGNSFDNAPSPPPPSRQNQNVPGKSRSTAAGSVSGGDQKPTNEKKKKLKLPVGWIIGIILACCLLLLFVFIVAVLCTQRKASKPMTPSASSEKEMAVQQNGMPDPENGKMESNNGSPIMATSYTVASLQAATNGFSQECLIGEGSLGRVYLAEFPNFKTVAVKKIETAALALREEEFLEAVSGMSHLKHPNIVPLHGYCTENGHRLLAHEHIKNGNLHDMLHRVVDDRHRTLPWNARVRIALGTARALEYLHEECSPSVVHRNFKAANILLDEELNPHLSDCGLVALRPNTERLLSTEMVGRFGYSAPEFALSGTYTVKSDVYSFGVVMLELLTGRMPLDSSRLLRSEQSLVRWAAPQLHDIDALTKMVDPALGGMYPAKSLSRFADIIALCVQPEPEFRPPMSEVVQALVRMVQRTSTVSRRSGGGSGFVYRNLDHDSIDVAV